MFISWVQQANWPYVVEISKTAWYNEQAKARYNILSTNEKTWQQNITQKLITLHNNDKPEWNKQVSDK